MKKYDKKTHPRAWAFKHMPARKQHANRDLLNRDLPTHQKTLSV